MFFLCDVTLSVYPHREGSKNMPGHGGTRTCDPWNTSPLLRQLSHAARSARACDISELSLIPSISVAQLAEQWTGVPGVADSSPTVARHVFRACPVWIYTQSNITQASYSPEYITPTQQIS